MYLCMYVCMYECMYVCVCMYVADVNTGRFFFESLALTTNKKCTMFESHIFNPTY